MLKKWIAAALLSVVFLQACETTKPVCVDAGSESAMCQPPAATSRNPFVRLDNWIQERAW